MQHLVQTWGRRVEAWHEPDTIRGYPLPRGGQFGNSKEFLDPDIFDDKNRMHPWIRGAIIAILAAYWGERYPDWASWTRIYLAGSLASYWWGTPDFDTLIGINVPLFLKSNPEFVGMTEEEISTMLTKGFYTELDPLMEDFSFPPSEDVWNVIQILSSHASSVEGLSSGSSMTNPSLRGVVVSAYLAPRQDSSIGDFRSSTALQPWNMQRFTNPRMANAGYVGDRGQPWVPEHDPSYPYRSITAMNQDAFEDCYALAATKHSDGLMTKLRYLKESWPTSSVNPLATEITFYVNANSWDIRKIKPYAAYEILHDEWWVYPSIVSKKWGPKALPHNFWEKMADLADEIKRILSTDDPTERQEDAKAMYDRIHGDRGNAFSDMGTGVGDWRSLQWIVLNRWGLLGPLEVAVHPDRPMAHVPPAVASLRMTGALEDLYGSGQAGMDRIFPEGLPKTGSPFPMAGRRRDREDVEWDKVHEAIQHPEGHFDDVDPRTLKGTQPSITRAGVAHYMSHDYRKHEDTFADNDKAGNRHPFVYTRHRDDGTEEHLLLAGHHRAVSDALAGRTTRAIHIHGGFGPARGGR